MIPGVVVSMSRRRQYTQVGPVGAAAYMDFESGTYARDGAAVALGDLLTGVSEVGSSGLVITEDSSNRPFATASLLSAFVTGATDGFTVVIDWDGLDSTSGPMLMIADHADPNSATNHMRIESFGNFVEGWGEDDNDFHGDSPSNSVVEGAIA